MARPHIYDISIDDVRLATQLDVDLLILCQIAIGKVWLAKEQELDYESLVDRLGEIQRELTTRAVRLKAGLDEST